MLSLKDKYALKQWESYRDNLVKATPVDLNEDAAAMRKRKDLLLDNWEEFAKYYFPNYCTSPFSKWQKRFAKKVIANKRITITRKIHRDGAKSVIAGIILPLYLKFKGDLKNMLIASYNWDNAAELLLPLQIQFESNQRIINDFGIQKGVISWSLGKFITTDACSFRAVGLGQSPRGTRNQEARPDYILVDDLDEDEMCRNPDRVEEAMKWTMGALFGCLSIEGGGRFVMVGNVISENAVLLKVSESADNTEQVDLLTKGEVNPAEVKRLKRKLAATKDEAEIKLLDECVRYAELGYAPNWNERFTLEDCVYMIQKMGYILSQREYFNNPMTVGKVFKKEWFTFKKLLPLNRYPFLVAYLDPGFKKTSTSDSKSLVLAALYEGMFHVIKVFAGKATIEEMIDWCYLMDDFVKRNGGTYTLKMEEVFLQSLLYKDFSAAAKLRGYPLAVGGDTRKKPDKDARIQSISGYYERGEVIHNDDEKENHHMVEYVNQFTGYSQNTKCKKDAPDATEGVFHILQQAVHLNTDISTGRRAVNRKRI